VVAGETLGGEVSSAAPSTGHASMSITGPSFSCPDIPTSARFKQTPGAAVFAAYAPGCQHMRARRQINRAAPLSYTRLGVADACVGGGAVAFIP